MEGMDMVQAIFGSTLILFILVSLAVLDLILKAFALWRSARNGQSGWFVCLIIFNTCGILPLIYLLLHPKSAEK